MTAASISAYLLIRAVAAAFFRQHPPGLDAGHGAFGGGADAAELFVERSLGIVELAAGVFTPAHYTTSARRCSASSISLGLPTVARSRLELDLCVMGTNEHVGAVKVCGKVTHSHRHEREAP